MTQKQIIREFEKFSKAEKTAVICQLLQIFEKDLSDAANKPNDKKPFTVEAVRLNPVRDFDFDNIGKLIEEIEGEFHR